MKDESTCKGHGGVKEHGVGTWKGKWGSNPVARDEASENQPVIDFACFAVEFRCYLHAPQKRDPFGNSNTAIDTTHLIDNLCL